MTVPILRLAASWLALSGMAALVVGCGGSRPLSPDAQALAFANVVNLRTGGDLPESKWLCRGPCGAIPTRLTRSEHAPAFGCEGRGSGASDVMGISSRVLHLKRNEQGSVSAAHPEGEVLSMVYVLPSAVLARQELAAAHECAARLLARGTMFHEPGLPARFASLHASLPGVSVVELRRSFRSRELEGGAVSPVHYVDEFNFVIGRAEISLIAGGTPNPFPSVMEQRLLSLLYAAASTHKP